MPTIETRFARLSVDANHARWSLEGRDERSPRLSGCTLRVDYRLDGRQHHLVGSPLRSPGERGVRPPPAAGSHGLLETLALAAAPDVYGLALELSFALPAEQPAVYWQARLRNSGPHPLHIERIEMLAASTTHSPALPGRPSTSGVIHRLSPENAAFYTNGWQSWSYTGAFRPGDRYRRTLLGPIRAPTDFNAGTPQPLRRGRFASDMFAVLGDVISRRGVLLGFLAQRRQFGSLSAELAPRWSGVRLWANGDMARLDPGATMETDWACAFFIDIDAPDPLGGYIEAVACENGIPPAVSAVADIPTGWCSWYQFSSEDLLQGTVTAADIRANLSAVARMREDLPLDLIQIDDGFETKVGDWFDFTPGFPGGVAAAASEIHAAGFTPGLWLAPFIVDPSSKLFAEHPDWVIRKPNGKPANAGYLWRRFAAGLDLTHPAALDYARRVIHTAVHEWGFQYLKLDFLYAAALPGERRDPTQTRAQALIAGLQTIRAAAGPETFLLGCGCPLGPAVGFVDDMRVSTDTAVRWKPAVNNIETFFAHEPNLPSARNACHNSLTRAALHRRWWINDPDCLLVRPDTRLTLDELHTVATVIALTGGSLLLSDDLPALPPERLRIVQALLPLIGKRPQVIDWLDSSTPRLVRVDLENATGRWSLLGILNWTDQPHKAVVPIRDFGLDQNLEYHFRSFWDGTLHPHMPGRVDGILLDKDIPAHGVLLLAARPVTYDGPQYLGSDLHISQGLEVQGWQWDPSARRLSLRLQRPGLAAGHVDLALPSKPSRAALGGVPMPWTQPAEGCYRFEVSFDQAAELVISFPE